MLSWLRFHPFLSCLFLPSSACSAWYLSCWCCLHLGPLHVFLTPGRRNHFAYYNYHAYEGNTVFDTVLSLVTKNFSDCKSCVSLWQMKDYLIYLKGFFPRDCFCEVVICFVSCHLIICSVNKHQMDDEHAVIQRVQPSSYG